MAYHNQKVQDDEGVIRSEPVPVPAQREDPDQTSAHYGTDVGPDHRDEPGYAPDGTQRDPYQADPGYDPDATRVHPLDDDADATRPIDAGDPDHHRTDDSTLDTYDADRDPKDEPVSPGRDTIDPYEDAVDSSANGATATKTSLVDEPATETHDDVVATDDETTHDETTRDETAHDETVDHEPASDLMPGDVPAEPVAVLIPTDAAQGLRERWREVQLRFVDDPRAAAGEAQGLVEEAVQALTAALTAQKDDLGGWQSNGGSDTEQLRVTVRGYRDFLDRLLDT